MSAKVRTAIGVKDLTSPATIHANAWLGVAEGLVGEFLAATHVILPTSFNSGPIVNMPINPATISASSLKAAIIGAISGVSTTPAGSHLAYWNAVGSGTIGQFAGIPAEPGPVPPPAPAIPKAQTLILVSTTLPVSHTVVGPAFIGIPPPYTAATYLAKLLTDAIGSADKTGPGTVHANMWGAVADVLAQFIIDYYKTVITPGGASGGVSILGTIF